MTKQQTKQIKLENGKIYNVLIQRSKRKTISITIKSDLTLLVRTTNKMTDENVVKHLNSHISWIEKHYDKVAVAKEQADAEGNFSDAEIAQMKKNLAIKLKELLPEYATIMNLKYNKVTVKCQKTRWGSCSTKRNLNFNCLLNEAPESVLRYVIVHELSHLNQMNHSKKFWECVAKYYPTYKTQEKWLKTEGKKLLMRKRVGSFFAK